MTESMTCFLSERIQVVACRNSKNWIVSAPVFLLNCLSGVGWEEGLLSKEWSTVNARLKCIRNARVLTPNCFPGLVLLCPQWFLRWKQKQICLHFFWKVPCLSDYDCPFLIQVWVGKKKDSPVVHFRVMTLAYCWNHDFPAFCLLGFGLSFTLVIPRQISGRNKFPSGRGISQTAYSASRQKTFWTRS